MARWQPGSRERLRGAALQLFSEQGFEQTTVAEIADRVGVTKRTFFRHFTDKRGVLFADSGAMERQLEEATAGAPTELAALDAMAVAIASLDWLEIAPRFAHRLRQEVIEASPELTERELIKLEAITAAFVSGLRRRGTDETMAVLAAQTGLVVFRIAYQRWIEADVEIAFVDVVRTVISELRLLTAE